MKKTSTLWLRNSSRYSDAEVWPLVKAAYDSVERSIMPGQTMPRIIVKLTNCRGCYRGRAHWIEHVRCTKPGSYGSIVWHRILVRIGAPEKFPVQVRYPRFKGDMPEYECATYREGIVMVTAHEIEHCLGASGRKGGEFRCEMSAWDAIDFYRKHKADIDGDIAARANVVMLREAAKGTRRAAANAPEVKAAKDLKAAQDALAKWQRKEKLAHGKVKKYARRAKRLSAKLAAAHQPEDIRQAATRAEFASQQDEANRAEIIDESRAGIGDDE